MKIIIYFQFSGYLLNSNFSIVINLYYIISNFTSRKHYSYTLSTCLLLYSYKVVIQQLLKGCLFLSLLCNSGKESACPCRRRKRLRSHSWVRKMPWRRAQQPTPVFLPGEFHGQRSLEGYSPWGHRVGHD